MSGHRQMNHIPFGIRELVLIGTEPQRSSPLELLQENTQSHSGIFVPSPIYRFIHSPSIGSVHSDLISTLLREVGDPCLPLEGD